MKRTNVEHWWLAIFASLVFMANVPFVASAANITTAEARGIAKEAYIYGFPLVDSYRIMYFYNLDRRSPVFKAALNKFYNGARLQTPEDRTVVAPNSDTLYSGIALDLRAEPMVLTLPAIEKGRYYSVQMVDLYTFNFDYMGSRTTGNGGGQFLVVGPQASSRPHPAHHITQTPQKIKHLGLL